MTTRTKATRLAITSPPQIWRLKKETEQPNGGPEQGRPAPSRDGEPPRSEETGRGPLDVSRRAIRLGVTFFVIASVVGFVALFFISQDLGGSLRGFRRFEPLWALPCLLFASMDWFGGGVRVWLLLRPLDLRVSYWKCVQISGATAGFAYLTPSGVGGGPAQLYGLVREGVGVGPAVASNFASLLVNLMFLSAAGIIAWFSGAAGTIEQITLPVAEISAAELFKWTAFGFAGVVLVIVLFAIDPRPARKWLVRLFGSGQRVRTLLGWIDELHESLLIYARKGKMALALATLSGALHFGGRFMLGWGVLRGFGIEEGTFLTIVVLHVMLQFLLIFMPTPGGSGVGEILAPALMAPFLPSSLLVAYTAVWRFFLTYLTVALGGGLLLRWIGLDQAKMLAAGDAEDAIAAARRG